MFSFSNRQEGSQWANVVGAHGFDPACSDCNCSNTQVAYNTDPNGFRRLFCSGFRLLHGSPWTPLANEVVTGVYFDVHGRYQGADGGSFNNQILVNEVVVGNVNPGNSFSNNGICRWRIPSGSQNLTPLYDWNQDIEFGEPFLSELEIGVQRNDNSETMRVNAVRLQVHTALVILERDNVDFGEIYVGQFRDETIRLWVTGDGTVSGNITLTDCDAGFSILAGGGPFTLNSGSSKDVVLRFQPPADGYAMCELNVGVRDLSVTLDGVGIGPRCLVSNEGFHDFGDVYTGDTQNHAFYIENTGGGTLVGSVVIDVCDTDAFTVTSGLGGYALVRGQRHEVSVSFTPVTDDLYSCDLTLNQEECEDVNLFGNGVRPPCALSSTQHDFGIVEVGDSAEWSFWIENQTGGVLSGDVGLDPGFCDTGAFRIVAGAGHYDLAVGQRHDVTVEFAPPSTDLFFCSILTGCTADVDVEGGGIAIGACCDPETGGCEVTSEVDCLGEFQGSGTECPPDPPCPQPATGACCDPGTGACTITTGPDCFDEYLGDDTSCEPNPCTDDAFWVGYENGCALSPPEAGSFADANNWFAGVPGGADQAIFGSGFDPQGDGVDPRYIYFGDFCLSVPDCPQEEVPSIDALVRVLRVETGGWTFDFGPGGSGCTPSGSIEGSLEIGELLDVGASNGPAELELLGGSVNAGDIRVGSESSGDGILRISDCSVDAIDRKSVV